MGSHLTTTVMKVFLISALVSCAAAQYASPDLAEPPVYAYQYGVSDDYSGASFAQNEQRDGYSTSGSYRVALPDGRTQVVNYRTDGDSGNIQDVTYEGVASYGPAAVVAIAPLVTHAPVVHHAPFVHHAPIVHHAPLVHHSPLIAQHSPLIAHAPVVAHHGALAVTHPVAHHGFLGHSAVQNVHVPQFIG